MKIVAKLEETVKIETFIVEYNGQRYTYKDYINLENNKIVDTIIRDEEGNEVESEIYHAILEFIEESAQADEVE